MHVWFHLEGVMKSPASVERSENKVLGDALAVAVHLGRAFGVSISRASGASHAFGGCCAGSLCLVW